MTKAKKIKAYIACDTLYTGKTEHLHEYIRWVPNLEPTSNLSEAGLVVFTGGADVSSVLYGEVPHATTSAYPNRDLTEIYVFNKTKERGIPMLGICRGAQFLTVMNGGKLLQDVSDHQGGKHSIFFNTGDVREITSTHHQMMNPFVLKEDKYELIAYAYELVMADHLYYNDGVKSQIKLPQDFKEPEIVYYYDSNALCIQGHPERLKKPSEKDDLEIQIELVNDLLNGNMDKWKNK